MRRRQAPRDRRPPSLDGACDLAAAEIGYWLRAEYTSLGYASEAVAAVARRALANDACLRLEIRTPRDNRRSLAIPLRLGFARASPVAAASERWVL